MDVVIVYSEQPRLHVVTVDIISNPVGFLPVPLVVLPAKLVRVMEYLKAFIRSDCCPAE